MSTTRCRCNAGGLSWSIVFCALGFALVGCVDIEPTKDEEIERGLSKYFARNPAARIAASTSCAAEDPPLPTDTKDKDAYQKTLDALQLCLDRENDERYRKVLEAKIERLKARWDELTKEDAAKPSTPPPAGDTPPPEPKPSEGEVKAAKESTAAKSEKLGLRVEDFKSYYNELTKKEVVELNEKRAGQDGYLTKTQASLVLLPNLNMFQPAIIQSFSLRNIFQAFNPNSDPTDVRAEVETDLARKRIVTVEYEPEHKDKLTDEFDMNRLSPEQFQLAVDAIADERLAHRWWHTRADLFSLDVGLAHPDVAVGNNSKSFKRRVDEGLPEFLFGGGVHFGSLELSSGVVLYREASGTSSGNSDATAGDFRVAYYIGFTLEIFQKNIQFN